MVIHITVTIFALIAVASASFPQSKCNSKPVYYKVTFANFLKGSRQDFKRPIPPSGLAFSPLSAVTHSPRFSFLSINGYASPQVEQIAETGGNGRFLAYAKAQSAVSSVEGSMGPAMPGKRVSVIVKATCAHPYLTALSMIAPSPDWIVQINNLSLLNSKGRFIKKRYGKLFAYDVGTDSSDQFTDPADASLDMPTEPPQTIVRLSEDATDPFGRKAVGRYFIHMVRAPRM